MRWQHCLDHADNIQKPAEPPDCVLGKVTQPTDSRLSETRSIWTRTLFGFICRMLLPLLHVWPAFAINSWLPHDVTSDTTPDVSESPSSFSFSSAVTWRRGRLEYAADRLSLRKEVDSASILNSSLGYPDTVRWQHVLAPHIRLAGDLMFCQCYHQGGQIG